MQQTILITGAKGQLGIEIGKISNKLPEFDFIFTDIDNLDITNTQATTDFVKQKQPVAIINCAAYTAVDKAEVETEKAENINKTGAYNLAKAAFSNNAFLLHISTDFVFDGKTNTPYTETNTPNPIGVYGQTKLWGEEQIKDSKADYAIVRTSWLYSDGNANFLNTMLKLGNIQQTINVVFDQIGTPTAAPDLAEVLLLMIRKKIIEKQPISGIYHYSNEGVCSWYDFAVQIMQQAQLECKVQPIHTSEYPTPALRPAFSVLDKTKIKKTLNIQIPHWEDSLTKVIMSKKRNKKVN